MIVKIGRTNIYISDDLSVDEAADLLIRRVHDCSKKLDRRYYRSIIIRSKNPAKVVSNEVSRRF
jgi:hypothetical protein